MTAELTDKWTVSHEFAFVHGGGACDSTSRQEGANGRARPSLPRSADPVSWKSSQVLADALSSPEPWACPMMTGYSSVCFLHRPRTSTSSEVEPRAASR
jgi:hypothetical protein